MSLTNEMLEFNKKFVDEKQYESFSSTKNPSKKIAVLSCMDTRLTELLPAALNFRNGEIKIIKNAGAIISHAFGSVMRSILIAVYELEVEDIVVIGHHDCGVQNMDAARLIHKMENKGVKKEKIDYVRNCGVDLEKWLKGFNNVEDSIRETVNAIRKHPLITSDIRVYGFIIDPVTGKIDNISTT